MTTAKSTIRALSLSCLGAVMALGISGLMPTSEADARRPNRLARCQQDLAHVSRDLASYQAAYEALEAGLQRVERINAQRPRNARNKIRKATRKARRRAAQFVAPAVPAPAPPPPPAAPAPPVYDEPAPPQPAPQAIDRRTFRRLLRSVKDEPFPKERLATMREAARHHWFTVRQVIALINACVHESTKIDVAVMLHSNVIDVENWFSVYDAFVHTSSRKKVERRLGRPRR